MTTVIGAAAPVQCWRSMWTARCIRACGTHPCLRPESRMQLATSTTVCLAQISTVSVWNHLTVLRGLHSQPTSASTALLRLDVLGALATTTISLVRPISELHLSVLCTRRGCLPTCTTGTNYIEKTRAIFASL